MFRYAPGRGAVYALRFLEGYRGSFVQCKGYKAYVKLIKGDWPEGPWTSPKLHRRLNCLGITRERNSQRMSPMDEKKLTLK